LKKLYLTSQQAAKLGNDLIEYATMRDSINGLLFKGFVISFGDMLADELQPELSLEMTAISEFIAINADD